MKPHRFAQMVNEVRELAFQYGHMEQFRCRVADLLGKYIHVEHDSKGVPKQAEAPAVVVPELTPDDCLELDEILQEGPPYDDVIPKLAAWICEHSRAIPADRVPGEGQMAVDREELCLLRQLESGWREPYDLSAGERARIIARLDALRANQGGAAT